MGNTCSNKLKSEKDIVITNSLLSIKKKNIGISQIDSSQINEEILYQYQIQTAPPLQTLQRPIKSTKIKNKLSNINEIIYEDGTIYEGQADQNIPHGKGIVKYINKDDFQGEFLNGTAFGKGIYYYDSGDLYEGEFYEDKKNGMGKETYINGDFYHGKFKMGEKFGRGKYTYKNGSCYNGQFKGDKRNGLGIFKTNLGDYYIGDWVDNFMDGKGKLTKSDGQVYEGGFKSGYYQGVGVLVRNGDRYEGNFNVGEFNGEFEVIYEDGNVRTIEYNNGVEVGK